MNLHNSPTVQMAVHKKKAADAKLKVMAELDNSGALDGGVTG